MVPQVASTSDPYWHAVVREVEAADGPASFKPRAGGAWPFEVAFDPAALERHAHAMPAFVLQGEPGQGRKLSGAGGRVPFLRMLACHHHSRGTIHGGPTDQQSQNLLRQSTDTPTPTPAAASLPCAALVTAASSEALGPVLREAYLRCLDAATTALEAQAAKAADEEPATASQQVGASVGIECLHHRGHKVGRRPWDRSVASALPSPIFYWRKAVH